MNQKDGLEERLFKGQDYVILFLAALSSSFSDSYFFIGSQALTWNSESVMTPMVDCLRAIVGRTTGSHLNIQYKYKYKYIYKYKYKYKYEYNYKYKYKYKYKYIFKIHIHIQIQNT